MLHNQKNIVMNRIEKIAQKVYRGNENAIYMLINDLEEFFEMNKTTKDVEKMTTEEFNQYVKNIYDERI